jgi:protein tyrosine phosphatase
MALFSNSKNMMMKSEGVLRQEFELLNQLVPMTKACDLYQLATQYPSALSGLNYTRNRYKDVLPEESTRVHLRHLQDDDDTDYINANFIPGHKQKYISCQAPLPNTTNHFWTMVWEQNSPLIVMLTRTIEGERKKADVYWPDCEDEPQQYGELTVTLKSITRLPFITIRTMLLSNGESEEREVFQLHYTEWPDFGVPQTTHNIRELIRLMNMYKQQGVAKGLSGPIIAHCSAGIGRCGTFIAILICLEKLIEGISADSISLVEIVSQMRKARTGMVQTDHQYIFIYQVLDDIIREKQLKFLTTKRASLCRVSCDDLPAEPSEEASKRPSAVPCKH